MTVSIIIFSKFIFQRNWAILSGFWNISDQSGRFEPSQERRRRRYAAPPVRRRSSSKWMWDTKRSQFASYGKLFWGESVACSSFLGSAWLGVSTVFLTVQIGWNWHKLAPAGLRSPFSRKSCGCRMWQTRESMIMYCYHTLFCWYIGIEWNIHSTSILSKFPLVSWLYTEKTFESSFSNCWKQALNRLDFFSGNDRSPEKTALPQIHTKN